MLEEQEPYRGERLKKARQEAGLSRDELARRLGVAARSVARWEDGEREPEPELQERIRQALEEPGVWVEMVPVEEIVSSPFQAREEFSEESLNSLAESIRRQGVLQPVVVRPLVRGEGSREGESNGGRYELIAGERRLRAAKLAGLRTIPAMIRSASDVDARVQSLMENVHREDLNPLERARALEDLKNATGWTWQQVAELLGVSRQWVHEMRQLTGLSEDVQRMVSEGVLPVGTAAALSRIEAAEQQEEVARVVVEEKLGAREAARLPQVQAWKVKRREETQEAPVRLRRQQVFASEFFRVLDPLLLFLRTRLSFPHEISEGERRECLERLEELKAAISAWERECRRAFREPVAGGQ